MIGAGYSMSRRPYDPMKNVLWYHWREEIDSQAYAMVALATEVWRGGVYAAGTFLLVSRDVSVYRAREHVCEKLSREMKDLTHVRALNPGYVQHRHGMPWRGWVRDLRR